MRSLGKGRIVHVGADLGGGELEALFAQILGFFGVKRVPGTASPAPGLHMRHFITNTGLQDIWVLFNESDKAITTDLTFLTGAHPPSLTNVVTGQTVEIARDAAGDAVRGIALNPWQTLMYVSPRGDTSAAPMEWLTLQRGWWQGTTAPSTQHLPTPAEDQRFSLDLAQGWAFKPADGLSDDQAAALAQSEVDDTAWKRQDLGIWGLTEDAGVRRAVLRRKFTVPARWTKGGVFLCAQRDGGIFKDEGRIFLDGQVLHRFSNDGIYLNQAGDTLKPGTTHVLALDIRTKSMLGGTRCGVWIYHLPDPQDRQDLGGDWASYSDVLTATGHQLLPGSVKAAFLSRTVTIPADQKNRNVVIHVETARPVKGVMVNGCYLLRQFYWGGTMFSINVTPFVKFGEENLVELVNDMDPGGTLISLVEIRYYDKNVYP